MAGIPWKRGSLSRMFCILLAATTIGCLDRGPDDGGEQVTPPPFPGQNDQCVEQEDGDNEYPMYEDTDGDGWGNTAVVGWYCYEYVEDMSTPADGSSPTPNPTPPDNYVAQDGDCDDTDPDINPGMAEQCNGIDDNCSGTADEDLVEYTLYEDSDGDGWGSDTADTVTHCSTELDGYVEMAGDCKDADAEVYPGAVDICDTKDNDCDGAFDEDSATVTTYYDADGDGWGIPETSQTIPDCYVQDDFWVENVGDCNDERDDIYPGAPEACDGTDYNCDGQLPDGSTDADGDGVLACEGDCQDNDPNVYPGKEEECNGYDDNCDGDLFPGGEDDEDGDGYFTCDGDCDDERADVNPDEEEVCDGIDNDCNSATQPEGGSEEDTDGDGFYVCSGDCKDTDWSINPNAYEDPFACDGVDRDCNGVIEGNLDLDEDGISACDGDCDDTDRSVNPDAEELCDGVDTNCDGEVEGETDGDGDGYRVCAGDCDDENADVNPLASEVCDGVDNNCDLRQDEGFDGDGDGYTDIEACPETGEDCDDGDPDVNPGVEEDICWDEEDQDCDGTDGMPEVCDDGEDNDCDDGIDQDDPEGCSAPEEEGEAFTQAVFETIKEVHETRSDR